MKTGGSFTATTALALLICGSAGATEWRVPGRFPTLQAAIDSSLVKDGDVIRVQPGRRTGATVTKAVVLRALGCVKIVDGPAVNDLGRAGFLDRPLSFRGTSIGSGPEESAKRPATGPRWSSRGPGGRVGWAEGSAGAHAAGGAAPFAPPFICASGRNAPRKARISSEEPARLWADRGSPWWEREGCYFFDGPGRAMKRCVKSASIESASRMPSFSITTKLTQSTKL